MDGCSSGSFWARWILLAGRTAARLLMNVCIFTPLNRLVIPSGVPRHIIEVVSGLLRDPSLQISFFANKAEAERYLPSQDERWTSAPRVMFERPTSAMVRRWGIFNGPSFEAMGGDADWLYLPADGYVTVERAKLAVTIHDVYKLEPPAPGEDRWGHYKARLRHWIIYRRVASRADRIITVSQFSADRIMHHLGVPASRIEVAHNGVSRAFFEPQEKLWAALQEKLRVEEQRFFVYSGGLKAKKNGAGIIAAWRAFEERMPGFKLVILGHHDAAFRERAGRELKRAVYPDRLSDAEMASLLSRSAGMFFPSFYEGFGMPVVEAFAAGTCVVASDIPATREIAGDTAFYVNPHEASSMADGLSRCVALGDERAARVRAGRDRAATFTWDACVSRVRGVFN